GRAGMGVAAERVLTPAVLARSRILASGRPRALLLVPEEARLDFEDIGGGADPQWVVVGDLGTGFTFERLNEAFLALRQGARLLALHKNPFWRDGEAGLKLDAGAFVAGLEFAAQVRAEVVGKPAAAFFGLALELLRLPAQRVLVVGDDVDNDGRGAAAVGCRTALVRTGKFAASAGASDFLPDFVLASVAELSI
ncbi:MAG TPA: HAD hydrolase-like protein, partial [Candidatus Polarisedimenticolaceae bacterium]|nr:HAD hydrolase-like protein [Candidatus Polarisedimenticolaceae bacterium]